MVGVPCAIKMVEQEMFSNWGYSSLSKLLKSRAFSEMKHAEALIERLMFLEGTPDVTKLGFLAIGKDPESMIANEHESEELAIEGYNEAIAIATEAKDHGSVKLFEKILKDEEAHINTVEECQSLINQLGLKNFLIEYI
jgi:bacterioferritin